MRYGRRITPTSNELTQSISQSNCLTSTRKRQNSLLISDNEHGQNATLYDKNDDSIVHR